MNEKDHSHVGSAVNFEITPDKIYFNGYSIGMSPTDVTITLFQDDEQMASLKTSHSMVKSLGIDVKEAIEILEKKTGQLILTAYEMQTLIEKDDNQ